MPEKPRDIRVQSKGIDPFSIRVTDGDGNLINHVRSVTWRCRYPSVPTFVIEGDGLELDVSGELCGSDAEVRLREIRAYIDDQIQVSEEAERVFEGHPAATQSNGALIVLREMREQFFGD